ncbi:hypothetical protein BDN72DRAFT_312019 [Pluteus cervinus]|uniref:Uncharacterized protein n=1 Tax=Pluteus cervinus TaxID=181527 RepID=A0ACD3B2J4_9AGAR|nr:hypothetical protein BDN72DRAFT_312019 [Pluteus cervinus]
MMPTNVYSCNPPRSFVSRYSPPHSRIRSFDVLGYAPRLNSQQQASLYSTMVLGIVTFSLLYPHQPLPPRSTSILVSSFTIQYRGRSRGFSVLSFLDSRSFQTCRLAIACSCFDQLVAIPARCLFSVLQNSKELSGSYGIRI